jgi:hypothetical protein
MDGLINLVNRLTGYIEIAMESINVSAIDFGLAALRKYINTKDAERVVKILLTIRTNIIKYK